jgi:hypothetical protein
LEKAQEACLACSSCASITYESKYGYYALKESSFPFNPSAIDHDFAFQKRPGDTLTECVEPDPLPTIGPTPMPSRGDYYNTILYNGRLYATINDAPVDGTDYEAYRQNSFWKLSPYWGLAANNIDSRYVASTHTWSSYVLGMADGSCIGTLFYPPQAGIFQFRDDIHSNGDGFLSGCLSRSLGSMLISRIVSALAPPPPEPTRTYEICPMVATTGLPVSPCCGGNMPFITFHFSVTFIGRNAFVYCPSIRGVKFSADIRSIAEGGFYGTGITTVDFPSTITSVGVQAFMLSALVTVTIPKSITFGSGAFQSCPSLNWVTINSGVTSIPMFMFAYSTALVSASRLGQ